MTEEENENIIEGVYVGDYLVYAIPLFLLNYTYGKLLTTINYDLPKRKVSKYQDNLYRFSAAKSQANILELSQNIIDKSGQKMPFKDFRKIAKEINVKYNDEWLRTEQDTSIEINDAALKWQNIEENKKEFPLLKYQTMEDSRVRDSHVILNGITRPVNDSFWNTHYPPIDWNDRCIVIPKKSGTITDFKKKGLSKSDLDIVNPLFSANWGKVNYIFSNDHPYFKVAKKHKLKQKYFV